MPSGIVCIGGGITGAFAAYFLALRGAEVTLVERDGIGVHASGNNPGGLNPLHGPGIPGRLEAFAMASMRLHLESWADIRRRSGIAFDGQRRARLHVGIEPGDEQTLAITETLHGAASGFSARRLSGPELGEFAPGLAPDAVSGLLTDGNVRVDPGPYTRAVAQAAISHGARVITGNVSGLRRRGDQVTGVEVGGETIGCTGVVIATGAWSQAPARWLDIELKVEAVKGDLLLLRYPGPTPRCEITWRGFGIYPNRQAGTAWAGGTEDRVGLDTTPSANARTLILDGVRRLMPGLGEPQVVRHVTGLRPVTPDGFPIVGRPAGWANVCLATGAGRKGMLFGAALGLAACEVLLDGASQLPIEACPLAGTIAGTRR